MPHVYPFKDEGSDRIRSQVFDKRAATEAPSTAGAVAAEDVSITDSGAYFTGTDVEAALQELGAASGGAGAMSYLGSATVTGSAATTLVISGLDLDTDSSYYVEIELANATASNSNVSLYYNSDTTAANYYCERFSASGASPTSARANDSILATLPASQYLEIRLKIRNGQDSKAKCTFDGNQDQPSNITYRAGSHAWTSTANVTGITLSAAVANSLAVGSTIRVFKVNN